MIKFWGVEEVGNWLESLGLAEYKEQFASHDIRGPELLNLDRPDLKVGNTPGPLKIRRQDGMLPSQ